VQALSKIVREFVDLVFAVDSDGLARSVEYNLAMVALADVGLNLGEEIGIDLAVEVVGELREEIGAGHALAPEFFSLK
jgi:hypothetical protein